MSNRWDWLGRKKLVCLEACPVYLMVSEEEIGSSVVEEGCMGHFADIVVGRSYPAAGIGFEVDIDLAVDCIGSAEDADFLDTVPEEAVGSFEEGSSLEVGVVGAAAVDFEFASQMEERYCVVSRDLRLWLSPYLEETGSLALCMGRGR